MYKKNAQGWAKHLDFILLDAAALAASFFVANYLRHRTSELFWTDLYRSLLLTASLINLLIVLIFNMFHGVLRRNFLQELIKIAEQDVILFVSVSSYLYVTKTGDQTSRLVVGLAVVSHFLITFVVRQLRKQILRKRMANGSGDALLLMAEEADMPALIREVQDNNFAFNSIIGTVIREETEQKEIEGVPVVATYDTVCDYVKRNWVDEVLISVRGGQQMPADIIDTLISMGVTVHVSFARGESSIVARQTMENVGGLQVITMSMNYMSPLERTLKRGMDIAGGLVGCAATGILYLFVAPKIKKESPGPVFFAQTRIGQNGKPFKFYKFRSMYLDAEERKKELMEQNRIKDGMMFKMEFDPRVIGNKIDENGNKTTGIGEFIRRTSIDEFPQFYNVLRGDMSLVGTRPPTMDEFVKYDAHHKARLAARPGITGMWQISGRSNILDFEEVVKLDTKYINHWSLGLDLRILFKTVQAVLHKDGSM